MSSITSSRLPERPERKVTSHDLEDAVGRSSSRASQYEAYLKGLETKLSENLSNFRAVESLLQEAFTSLNRNTKRANRALEIHVPHINEELDLSKDELTNLGDNLPTIRAQVSDIRHVYDSGRQKGQQLVADLSWLDTDFYERWRTIIFTSSSPVSWRWKTLMRLLFAASFILLTHMSYLAIMGAYRAHRQRLVWGERLMS